MSFLPVYIRPFHHCFAGVHPSDGRHEYPARHHRRVSVHILRSGSCGNSTRLLSRRSVTVGEKVYSSHSIRRSSIARSGPIFSGNKIHHQHGKVLPIPKTTERFLVLFLEVDRYMVYSQAYGRSLGMSPYVSFKIKHQILWSTGDFTNNIKMNGNPETLAVESVHDGAVSLRRPYVTDRKVVSTHCFHKPWIQSGRMRQFRIHLFIR